MKIKVIEPKRLEQMSLALYNDKTSAIVGWGLEEDRRLFVFYVDGACDVIELSHVSVSTWLTLLHAACHGYGLEYLASRYVTWTTYDHEHLALAALEKTLA